MSGIIRATGPPNLSHEDRPLGHRMSGIIRATGPPNLSHEDKPLGHVHDFRYYQGNSAP